MTESQQGLPVEPGAPSVSYLVAAYNAESTIGRTLRSLRAQDRDDWEAIVVNDGSSDSTGPVVAAQAAQDPRITLHAQDNRGAAAARNAAATKARGVFIAYVDADDALAPTHLSAMLDLVAREPGFDIYSSDALFVKSDGSTEPVYGYRVARSIGLEDEMADSLILGGGTLVRAEAFRALGGFREHIYAEDYDLWLRALTRGYRHVATPEPLYLYHVDGASRRAENKVGVFTSAIQSLEDLIDSGSLDERQTSRARECLVHYRAELAFASQSSGFGRLVERVVGARLAPRTLRLIHSFSWIARPIRRGLALLISHRGSRSQPGPGRRAGS